MTMSPRQTRNLSAVAIFIIVGVFVGYYTQNEWWGIGASVMTGFIYISSITAVDWARMRTAALITNIGVKGHNSIIADDKFTVGSPVEDEANYMLLCAGGSSIVELPMHGFGPYYICPEEFVEETNSGTVAIADWMSIKYDQLPRFLQEMLSWQVHFNPLTSEIYFAETSQINNSSSQTNIELATKVARLQQSFNSLITENDELNRALNAKKIREDVNKNKIQYVPVSVLKD